MSCLSNDQELVQSEPNSHPENRDGKQKTKTTQNKTNKKKLTITY